jgi:hypothetical protein
VGGGFGLGVAVLCVLLRAFELSGLCVPLKRGGFF